MWAVFLKSEVQEIWAVQGKETQEKVPPGWERWARIWRVQRRVLPVKSWHHLEWFFRFLLKRSHGR